MYFYIENIILEIQEKYENPPSDIQNVDDYKQGLFDAISIIEKSRRELEEKRRKVCEMADGCGLMIINNF